MGRQAWIHGISQARGPKRKKKRKTGKKKILKHTQGNRVKIEVAAEVSVIN